VSDQTSIAWCHATFNPWEGCSRVSEGCKNCYAEARAKRVGTVQWGPSGTRRVASESYWKQPLKWDREAKAAGERRRVFCASLADVFEDRPELVEPRARLFGIIDVTPNLNWLLLTKRPRNVRPLAYRAWCKPVSGHVSQNEGDGRKWKFPSNVWLGVSVENQLAADERIPVLMKIPAAVRFLSCEPLLGPVDVSLWLPAPCHYCAVLVEGFKKADCPYCHGGGRMLAYDGAGRQTRGIDWLIAGGESGPNARPCHLSWVRSLVGQCRDAVVPCFTKQLGVAPLGMSRLRDRKGGDMEEWPEDLKVREFPGGEAS
jgi:protein gp37